MGGKENQHSTYFLWRPTWYQIAKILVKTLTNAFLEFFRKRLKHFRIVKLSLERRKRNSKQNETIDAEREQVEVAGELGSSAETSHPLMLMIPLRELKI